MTRMRWDRLGRVGASTWKHGMITSVGLGGGYDNLHRWIQGYDDRAALLTALVKPKRSRYRRPRKTYKIKRMAAKETE